mmetsp:Transcript_26608/g.37384  ORF Transcript_26608/g.37384 Transcript_26608/m.37384 type:complete len:200 (-) Transcript_26608:239-838(-)
MTMMNLATKLSKIFWILILLYLQLYLSTLEVMMIVILNKISKTKNLHQVLKMLVHPPCFLRNHSYRDVTVARIHHKDIPTSRRSNKKHYLSLTIPLKSHRTNNSNVFIHREELVQEIVSLIIPCHLLALFHQQLPACSNTKLTSIICRFINNSYAIPFITGELSTIIIPMLLVVDLIYFLMQVVTAVKQTQVLKTQLHD